MVEKYTFGIIGLGTMGRNLLLNMADHNFKVAGHDKDNQKIELLAKESKGKTNVKGFNQATEFVQSLQTPRAIMVLVPAGKIVDNVIQELVPLLDKGDLIIDGGNSYFSDTNRRVVELKEKGLHFFVRAFISTRRVREQWEIASELRIALLKSFAENDVFIAYPHAIVHPHRVIKNDKAAHYPSADEADAINIKLDT